MQNRNPSPVKILLIEDNPQDARLVYDILSESDMDFEIEHKDRLKKALSNFTGTRSMLKTNPTLERNFIFTLPKNNGGLS